MSEENTPIPAPDQFSLVISTLNQLSKEIAAIREDNRALDNKLEDINARLLPLTAKEVRRLVRFSGLIESMGTDKEDGLEVMRDNHKWLRILRVRSNIVTTTFITSLSISFIGALVGALWVGFKLAVRK